MFNLKGPQGQNPRTTVWETLFYVIPSFTYPHQHPVIRVTSPDHLTFLDFYHLKNQWRAAQTRQFSAHRYNNASLCTVTSNFALWRKTSSKRFILAFRCVKEGRRFLSCTVTNTTDPTRWQYELLLLWTPQIWTYYCCSPWLFGRWRYAPPKRRCLAVDAQNTWKYP